MAQSLRTIQAAMSAAGWPVTQMNAFYDVNPTILQNFLSGVTATVTNSGTLVDALVSGGSVNTSIMGNGLQIEIGENEQTAFQNTWFIEGHVQVTTTATVGLKAQLTTYDGLTLNTATSNVSWCMNVNGASNSSGVTAFNAAFSSSASNVVSVDFTAMLQIASGYGRVGLQFAQAVPTAANNTILGVYGYIRAETCLG
jgi:hypothetical protein